MFNRIKNQVNKKEGLGNPAHQKGKMMLMTIMINVISYFVLLGLVDHFILKGEIKNFIKGLFE